MNKRMILSLLLAAVMIVAAGCSKTEAQQPIEPTATQTPAATNQGLNENEIAPATPAATDTPAETKVAKKVTFFFVDKELMGMYRVPVEITADTEADLPKAALQAWMKGPTSEKLNNLVPPQVVVESLEVKDGIAYVSFSKELKNANLGSGGESYLIDQIAQIMKQFGGDKTQILIEGQMEETLLGHVTTNEPVLPSDPEQYEWLN